MPNQPQAHRTPQSTVGPRVGSDPIRVCVVEDHQAFREGLVDLLMISKGFHCVGAYPSLEVALRDMPLCDVVLMDIGLPGKSGIDGLRLVRERFPNVKVIMMTVFEDDHHISKSILSGANGYLLKRTPPAHLLQAIRDVLEGGMPVTPKVAASIAALFKQYAPSSPETTLSTRELEVLQLLSQGLKITVIAERLFLSPDTVRNHTRNIYEKLQVHSKSAAVAKAIRQGLV